MVKFLSTQGCNLSCVLKIEPKSFDNMIYTVPNLQIRISGDSKFWASNQDLLCMLIFFILGSVLVQQSETNLCPGHHFDRIQTIGIQDSVLSSKLTPEKRTIKSDCRRVLLQSCDSASKASNCLRRTKERIIQNVLICCSPSWSNRERKFISCTKKLHQSSNQKNKFWQTTIGYEN